jgi:hypothetical protein
MNIGSQQMHYFHFMLYLRIGLSTLRVNPGIEPKPPILFPAQRLTNGFLPRVTVRNSSRLAITSLA